MTTGYTIYNQNDGEGTHLPRDASRLFVVVRCYYAGYRRGFSTYVIGRYKTRKIALQAVRREEAKS